MWYPPARPGPRALVVLVALALGACAHGLPDVTPADIPRLQQEVASNPTDTDAQVQLGMAQYQAGAYQEALTSLQGAVDAGNQTGPALLYLGLVHEKLEEWSLARDAYTQYLEVGTTDEVKDQIRERLQLIGRNILRAQAQQALAQEAEITATANATPRSVAVLPFALNSQREDLEPLIYALSDMMITDFAVSNALVVLERTQVQTLLDEMALTEAGYAEPATGARAGRLLRAEHVLQGVLTTLAGDDLQADADILEVQSTSSVGELTEGSTLDGLFDMEKNIVIRTIRDVLGVALTPAEEQAILDNRMDNVLAFLAYGRGLREMDRGNYAAAAAEFRSAQLMEGGSNATIQSAIEAADGMADASGTAADDLAEAARSSGEIGQNGLLGPPSSGTTGATGTTGTTETVGTTAAMGTTGSTLGGTLTNLSEGVAPRPTSATLDLGSSSISQEAPKQTGDTDRQPVPETTGGESVPTSGEATIVLVIQSPGAES